VLILKRAIVRMTLLSSNTKTSSPVSLPLEPMVLLSLSRTMEKIMDAWPSTSSFDSPIPHYIQYPQPLKQFLKFISFTNFKSIEFSLMAQ
jgi:hypothetical protein